MDDVRYKPPGLPDAATGPASRWTSPWRAALAACLLAVAAPTAADPAPRPSAEPGLQWNDSLDARIAAARQSLTQMKSEPDWPSPPVRFPPPAVYGGYAPAQTDAADSAPTGPGLMPYFSMALAAGALGVLLLNRPEHRRGLGRTNDTQEARRRVVCCALLLVGLNLFDLACTLRAVPSAAFVELNPLADSLTPETPLLVAAKLTLTLACAASLLTFWRYRIAQLASWLAGTVYTVLSVRWAAYHSLHLG